MHIGASKSYINADIGGSDHFQDGGHGGHFGFPKIETCVVIGPKDMHTKFGVDWCRGVSHIDETNV